MRTTRQTPRTHRLRNRRRGLPAFAALLLAVMLCTLSVSAAVDLDAEFETESNSWENWPEGPSMWGHTACLMDAATGTVLYAKGANAERFPASITKVMTAMVVLDNCALDEIVTMTETGLADAYWESSNINPSLGEQFTVDQCLQMLLVKSANDIASQLAEHTSGSVEAFAQAMNDKAASLGCLNTHFTNASGLEDDNHYTSAYDMCLIMREAINYDKIREIWTMDYIEIPPTEFSDARYYEGHVYLRQQDNPYYYEDCFGGKTGYTDIAQSTLVCAAERNGLTLVGAVLGAPDTGTNAEDMVDLFNYGFDNFSAEALLAASTAEAEAEAETEESIPQPETETEDQTAEELTPAATPETTPEATPAAITTSEPKAVITEVPKEGKAVSSAKTIIYIIIICLLVAALAAIIFLEVRARKIRNQRRRRKR